MLGRSFPMLNATAIARHRTNTEMWFKLTAHLGHVCEGGYESLDYANSFQCNIVPLDDLAANYTIRNWESGILSGLFYGYRLIGFEKRKVVVEALDGSLGAAGVEGLAFAATLLLLYLFQKDYSSVNHEEWVISIQ